MNTHSQTSAPAQRDLNITLHNPSEKKRGLMWIKEQEIKWEESWEQALRAVTERRALQSMEVQKDWIKKQH